MASGVTIRLGIPSDLDNIVDSIQLIGDNCPQDLEMDRKVLLRGVGTLLSSKDKGFYLVAELAGDHAFVGCLAVTTEWSDWNAGHYWWFQSVYVRPQHRGRGVFQSLFSRVEQMAKDAADVISLRLYVERTNKVAKMTYEKLGMLHSHYDMYEKKVPK